MRHLANRRTNLGRLPGIYLCLMLGVFLSLRPATAETKMNEAPEDKFLWLEDVTGDKALDWVRAQNRRSTSALTNRTDFAEFQSRLLRILDAKERIPFISKHGKWYYNFWRDEQNPRGLWRRTSLTEYRKSEPLWETVLDLDTLAKAENENWVWKGNEVLYPDEDRTLVYLSRGGADAKVAREFDLKRKSFVPGGFTLPEAKSEVSWRDRDSLYVGTDFGPGSLTDSGYPRVVKLWRRGTPLKEATQVFAGEPGDVSCTASVIHDHGEKYELIDRATTFFTSRQFLNLKDGWTLIEKPDDATVGFFGRQLILRLRSDWPTAAKTYPGGAVLACDLKSFLKGSREFSVLFQPSERGSLAGMSDTRHYLILNELEEVKHRLYLLQFTRGRWRRQSMDTPPFGSVAITGVDPRKSDTFFMTVADFITPSSLFYGKVNGGKPEKLKGLPEFFNASRLGFEQHHATSKDGTRIPYFQVSRKDLPLNGRNPTLLYGYGGFEISMLPSYNAGVGACWLERGGTYVLANIRGGGEFGPQWHEAARKANRQRAYDDFIAVAEDLVSRKVAAPSHLGIQGGSNGGLLMGAMLTQRPDLFGAVVCQVPLLDMRRFHKLLAGASWMAEYGNPDAPAEWDYIRRYSPYHNLRQDVKYPPVLFTTSTRDDRVHPGHARKMVARMGELGHDVLYYENLEGGHGGAANNQQAAFMSALAYTFLWEHLR